MLKKYVEFEFALTTVCFTQHIRLDIYKKFQISYIYQRTPSNK